MYLESLKTYYIISFFCITWYEEAKFNYLNNSQFSCLYQKQIFESDFLVHVELLEFNVKKIF